MFDTFATQASDPQHISKGVTNKIGELSMVNPLELDAVQEECKSAIARLLPNPFGRAILRHATASLDYVRRLRSVIDQTGIDQIRAMVMSQDKHLLMAVSPPGKFPDDKCILVAFSAIEDQTITLTQGELDRLIQAVAAREGMGDAEVRIEAKKRADAGTNARGKRKLDDEVCDGIDLLAHVLVLMRREGLKPAITDPKLQQWVIKHFAGSPGLKKTFGGAAGNEAYVLAALGLPVLLHVPYHHPAQAAVAPTTVRRLVFDSSGPGLLPITHGNTGDARRWSGVLQLTPEIDATGQVSGPIFQIGKEKYRPERADRCILRVPNPQTAEPATWKKLRVTWQGNGLATWGAGSDEVLRDVATGVWFVEVDREDVPGLLDHDWPYFTLFQHSPTVDAKTQTLLIELATTVELGQIAKDVPVALIGGIQELAKKSSRPPALTELLRQALAEQLNALSSSGTSLHFEMSGVESAEVLDELKKLLQQSGIKNLSLNREELVQVTSEFGSPYFTSPASPVSDTAMGVYLRASELLKRLEIETVYVHDLELELFLRRNRQDEDLEAAHAELARQRQAMLLAKAAVPASLLKRAGEEDPWDLVLSTESLAALVAFTADYERLVTTINPATSGRAILTEGYHYPGIHGISVVVAPAIYVDFPSTVSLAGAGDKGFAVRAAMACQTP